MKCRMIGTVGDRRGVSILELTIVLPLLIVLLAGVVDFGFTLRNIQAVSEVAKLTAKDAAQSRECTGLRKNTLDRAVQNLANADFSSATWIPKICVQLADPTRGPTPANPANVSLIRVSIKNEAPCLLCIANILQDAQVGAESVFALDGDCRDQSENGCTDT